MNVARSSAGEPGHAGRCLRGEHQLNREADERDAAAGRKPRKRGAKLTAEPPEIRQHRERDDCARPRPQGWMDARRNAQQQRTGPIPAGPEQTCDEHGGRESNDAVRVFGAEQENRIDDAVLRRSGEKHQRRGADRQKHFPAERVHDQCQRLKGQHSLNAAHGVRQRALARSGPQRNCEYLMQRRPQLRVIDVENVVGWVVDDSGNHLRSFDSNLPVREAEQAHAETEDAAEDQDPDGAVHRAKYVVYLRPQATRYRGASGDRSAWSSACSSRRGRPEPHATARTR